MSRRRMMMGGHRPFITAVVTQDTTISLKYYDGNGMPVWYTWNLVAGENVFYGTSDFGIEDIEMINARLNTYLKSIDLRDSNTMVDIGGGNGSFYNCKSLDSVILPEGITVVGSGAFQGCTALTSVYLPDSLTSIGNNAFSGCTSLALTELPDSLTSIGSGAFQGCTALTSVYLPDSLTSIGNGAFSGCTSLALTELPGGLTSIGDSAFRYCTSLALTELTGGLTSIGNNAFLGCKKVSFTEIPVDVTDLKGNVFTDCTSIPYLHLLSPTMVTTVSNFARNTAWKIYVGDGTSAEHDDALLATYLADSVWATFSTRLDTWYNYLQSQNQ